MPNLLELEQELAIVQFGDGDGGGVNEFRGIGLAIHLNLKGVEEAHVGPELSITIGVPVSANGSGKSLHCE